MDEGSGEPELHDYRLDRVCGAKKRNSDEYCGLAKGWGTDHLGVGRCKRHGGNTPGQRLKARKDITKVRLDSAVKTFGVPVDTNPHEALMDEVRWTAGHVRWLRQQVQQLPTDQIAWGTAKVEKKESGEFPGIDVTESAQVHLLIELYMRERTHLVRVCQVAIAAGIEERRVEIAEKQGAMLAAALYAMFDRMGLTSTQRNMLPDLVPEMFHNLQQKWELN